MESLARPLRLLWNEASWFARATEVRVLWVQTSAALRSAALELLMAQEYHADNRSLFLRFDDPGTGKDLGFASRVARLREQFTSKAEGLRAAGLEVGALADGPANVSPLAEFALALKSATEALQPPLCGVVVVLAPVRIDDAAGFSADLRALLGTKELAGVRFVLVETDSVHLDRLAEKCGVRGLSARVVIDERAQTRELASLLEPAPGAAFSPRAPGYDSGGAMPLATPPARLGAPPPPTDEQLTAAGLSPAFVNGGGDALRNLLLAGALALREGRPADAISLQTRAVGLCQELQLREQEILQRLVLATYLLSGSLRREARKVCEKAAAQAREQGFLLLQAQAELSLGLIHGPKRGRTSGRHYEAAAKLAEQAGVATLAIECWRMAGQKAMEIKVERKSLHCFKRALVLASGLNAELARSTSAAEVARALAAFYRGKRLPQAESLEKLASDLEQGSPVESTITFV